MLPTSFLLLLTGCGGCGAPVEDTDALLPAETRLIRASMALRGIRPSTEELQLAMLDPGAVPFFVEDWLDDAEFGATIRDMHAEQLLLRSDLHELMPPVGALSDQTTYGIFEAISEGPLALIEETVLEGRPYSEIVTSPTLRVNAVGAAVWGADYDEDGPEWQAFAPGDGRPPWGILSDGAFWIRHVSNGSNNQRARANMIASALLCEDFLTRDIPLSDDLDLSDDDAVADAVNADPACVGCHQSLDPLGGFLWGYISSFERNDVAAINGEPCTTLAELDLSKSESASAALRQINEAAKCYPLEPWAGGLTMEGSGGQSYSMRDLWALLGLRAPGYYGLGDDQDELGTYLAADPRFAVCAVRRFYGYLTQTDPDTVPLQTQAELLAVFEDSGMDARELAKAVVLSEAFSSAEAPLQVIRPEQYARLIEDLTGFRWRTDLDRLSDCSEECIGELDLAVTDQFGFRAMAGGMDGYRTRLLVMARYAAEAAGHVVDSDLSGDTSLLLEQVSASTTDESAIRAQLSALHLRILGEEVSTQSDEVSQSYDLFAAALDRHGDPADAWKVVLTAMLQDPSVLFY
jgi:hypothetical protein